MIIRNDEHKRETSENVFGGSGSVTARAEYSLW